MSIVFFVLGAVWSSAFAQQVPLSEVADRAMAQSKLIQPGSSPFYLKATIAEKDSPDSDFKAEVELFWVSPEKWRRSLQSPDFSQTLIVNGTQISEQDTGDYFPFWLHELVTAITDPLPMLKALEQTNAHIRKPFGSERDTFCARFESKVGIPPVQNSAFSVFCFEGSRGLLESVVTPVFSVEFKNYKNFKDKRVARLLVTDPEPGTTIEAKISELSELTNPDEALFAISHPTPEDQQLQSVYLSEADLKSLSVKNHEIVWPTIRDGKTSGTLSLYVSIDKEGRVRETFPLNSDNSNLNPAARQQVQDWKFKPATIDGKPVQIESILTFAFSANIGNPVAILSDAEARKLATEIVEPRIPPGAGAPGATFTVRAIFDQDGKLQGVENPFGVPTDLFAAACDALTGWRFYPYLIDGKPDSFKADIIFGAPLPQDSH